MNDTWTELGRPTSREAAAFLEVEPKQVRTWTKNGFLVVLGNPTDDKHLIPRGFLVRREDYVGPFEALKGTITLLRNCGLIDTEIVGWLSSVEETLGETPLQVLLTGKKEAVRRITGALALRRWHLMNPTENPSFRD